jgi:hypothetical protein
MADELRDVLNEDMQVDAKAVYYAVLPELDELTHVEQVNLLLNWIKYVSLRRADQVTPLQVRSLMPAYVRMCRDFALRVAALPALKLDTEEDRCSCPNCRAEAEQLTKEEAN